MRANAFDGDNGLVREGFHETDLAVGERSGSCSRNHNGANCVAVLEHRYKKSASEPDRTRQTLMLPFSVELDIRYMHHRALENCPASPEASRRSGREYTMYLVEGLGREVVVGDMAHQFAVELNECAEQPIAQRNSISGDRVENGLHISLRSADEAQDLSRSRLAAFKSLNSCFSASTPRPGS